MQKKIADIRRNYKFSREKSLNEKNVASDPFIQFEKWFSDAVKVDGLESNAMFLATSTKSGKPSVRTVLLKGFSKEGFVFFTNYLSRKGSELKENPYASLLFFWKEPGRQIRIEGKIKKVSREESEEYFHSRPFSSQIAALSSDQSKALGDRKTIEKKFSNLKKKYTGTEVPLPDNWGGYILKPSRIEFWQGRENRMHDRILYVKSYSDWKISRLAP